MLNESQDEKAEGCEESIGSKRRHPWLWISISMGIALVVFVACCFATYFIAPMISEQKSANRSSQIEMSTTPKKDGTSPEAELSRLDGMSKLGDSFGLASAVVSLFALFSVIVAIGLQKQELDETQRSLKLAAHEATKQSTQFQLQNELMRDQQFETLFFRLLERQLQIVRTITHPQLGMHGQPALDKFREAIESATASYSADNERLHRELPLHCVNYFPLLEPYFESLLVILRLISWQEYPKQRYLVQFLTAQMSLTEKILVAFVGFTDHEELRPLVESTSLLVRVPERVRDYCIRHQVMGSEAFFEEARANVETLELQQ